MRELTVRVTLFVPDDLTDEKAIQLFQHIIDSGQEDAQESADDDGIESYDAELAASLEIKVNS